MQTTLPRLTTDLLDPSGAAARPLGRSRRLATSGLYLAAGVGYGVMGVGYLAGLAAHAEEWVGGVAPTVAGHLSAWYPVLIEFGFLGLLVALGGGYLAISVGERKRRQEAVIMAEVHHRAAVVAYEFKMREPETAYATALEKLQRARHLHGNLYRLHRDEQEAGAPRGSRKVEAADRRFEHRRTELRREMEESIAAIRSAIEDARAVDRERRPRVEETAAALAQARADMGVIRPEPRIARRAVGWMKALEFLPESSRVELHPISVAGSDSASASRSASSSPA